MKMLHFVTLGGYLTIMQNQNKDKKILDKSDRLLIVLMLFFINLLIFVVYFKDLSSLGNLSNSIGGLNSSVIIYIFGILFGIFTLILYIASFFGVVSKYKRYASVVITLCMVLITFLILIFSIECLQVNDNVLSSNSDENSIDALLKIIGAGTLIELIFPIIITIINAVLMKNVGEVYFSKNEDAEDELQEEKEEDVQDDYEKEMRAKIEKVKSQLRMQELEKEYLSLQSQLENPDKKQ